MAVVGFSPDTYNAGVFAKRRLSHLIQRLGPTKEVIAQRARQPDYNALTLSLSHRSLTVGLLNSPLVATALVRVWGAYVLDREAALR